MKKIICLANDPGGYSVVKPIFQALIEKGLDVDFYCFGIVPKIDNIYKENFNSVEEKVLQEIKMQNLALVITGTSWGSDFELQMIKLCKDNSVKTVSILDYWSNYKKRFLAGDNNYYYPNYLVVMDELSKQEALDDGVPCNILKVLGQPALDKYFDFSPTMDFESKSMLFISQPLSLLYGDKLGFDEVVAIEDCLTLAREHSFKINIKFHPKDAQAFKRKYAHFEVQGDIDELFCQYEYIVGMSSMGLLHACLMGKKVFSYQPNLKGEDFCITNKLGLTIKNYSFDELEADILNSYNKNTFIEKQKYIWADGNSVQRIVDFLLILFKQNSY